MDLAGRDLQIDRFEHQRIAVGLGETPDRKEWLAGGLDHGPRVCRIMAAA